MKTLNILLIIALVIAFAPAIQATDSDNAVKATKSQTLCPVMGGKINKSLYVDAEGKRIYVCCAGCIGKIKADPKKYIKALEDDGITLEKDPVTKKKKKKKDPHAGHNH